MDSNCFMPFIWWRGSYRSCCLRNATSTLSSSTVSRSSPTSFQTRETNRRSSVLFLENRDLPSLAASKDIYRSKYNLAREVIYQHLKTYLQKVNPDIQVHQFPAADSPEFQQHIQTYSVYFAMCHNGALRRQNVPSVEPMLKVIANIMASGLDVAVINEIEWRDIKVCHCPLFALGAILGKWIAN